MNFCHYRVLILRLVGKEINFDVLLMISNDWVLFIGLFFSLLQTSLLSMNYHYFSYRHTSPFCPLWVDGISAKKVFSAPCTTFFYTFHWALTMKSIGFLNCLCVMLCWLTVFLLQLWSSVLFWWGSTVVGSVL